MFFYILLRFEDMSLSGKMRKIFDGIMFVSSSRQTNKLQQLEA
jgi:hypothetical protein